MIVPPGRVDVTSAVFVMAMSASLPPPPPPPCTTIETVEELFPGLLSVELADSPTRPVLLIVVPAGAEFTVAAIFKVAVELALMSPIVQVPVELA